MDIEQKLYEKLDAFIQPIIHDMISNIKEEFKFSCYVFIVFIFDALWYFQLFAEFKRITCVDIEQKLYEKLDAFIQPIIHDVRKRSQGDTAIILRNELHSMEAMQV